jgi:hypothetical protein
MTALTRYQRLEATGLWRASVEDQRREVVVSVGDATLTISDLNDRALTHWSLAALERRNPGERPAIYSPDGDSGETLELGAGEAEMIAALESLRRAVERARPHPGRLRQGMVLGVVAVFVALLVFWLPGALRRHTVAVVPPVKRLEIGTALLGRITRVGGSACTTPEAAPILARLAERTGMRQLVVVRSGVADTLLLPGRIVVLNRTLIEGQEDPAVVAGYIMAEAVRAEADDPLAVLLRHGGVRAAFRLLTTGDLTRETLDRYAEHMLALPRPEVAEAPLLAAFAQRAIPSAPYAYARDITGESVLGLIEADPMAGRKLEPVLRDRDWVQLQSICGD